ncbi:YlaN family protein [Paenibacillus alkalitolerans]|uniref:YlaN family protein n=1 Tax=Paenibacillus alkalitolerans TaxID=2799335 RepID=UPI0018F5DEAF|nr:YlaN family protein [Paenibacillus alkalitolerans]
MSSSEMLHHLTQKAMHLLQEDARKIETLIQVQMENLATRKCPLYEEVLDTQMYGLSREIDFAVRAGLIQEAEGKELLVNLERNLAQLYEALAVNQNQST